jgi:hypothetical protein
MSDKDRQKKDHQRKDKKNQAMRDAQNARTQQAGGRTQGRDKSKFAIAGKGLEVPNEPGAGESDQHAKSKS